MSAFILKIFTKLDHKQDRAEEMDSLTPEQLQGLIRDYVADSLDAWAEDAYSRPPLNPDTWDEEFQQLEEQKINEVEELGTRDFRRISLIAKRLLSSQGLDLAPDTIDFKKLCVELLKTSAPMYNAFCDRMHGRYTKTDAQIVAEAVAKVDVPLRASPPPPPPPPYPTSNQSYPSATTCPPLPAACPPAASAGTSGKDKNLLGKVINEYATEKKNAGRWAPKTEKENLACYHLFLKWAGEEITVEEITAKLMREYKAALQQLPPNMEKSPEYRDKTIPELLQMAEQGRIPKFMGIATINKNLNRISTLLDYARKNGYIVTNPAEGMQLEQPKRDEELRDAFTLDDLHALFHSTQYEQDTFKHPYQFWIPLMALFTAARQNELAQLYLEDLRQEEEEGIWVFDFNAKHPGQRLKNKNAARLVPIHPFLLELGLVGYAKELRAKGETRLFPELNQRRDGFGQDVSRWFNGTGGQGGVAQGYRKQCGISPAPGEAKKDFHSFRHTTITFLVGKRVDSMLLHKFDGHQLGSMTYDRYGKSSSLVKAMKEEIIDILDFHKTIPLDHLRASRFARIPE